MSETLPRSPVPSDVGVPQRRRSTVRRGLSRGGLSGGGLSGPAHRFPRASTGRAARTVRRRVLILGVLLLLAGAGSASARVLPGPVAGPVGPSPAGRPGTLPTGTARADLADVRDGVYLSDGAGGSFAPSRRPAGATGAWPLLPEPEVVADFAPPPVAWAAGHRGVDLLGRPGQPVRAAKAGSVTFAGRIAGRGVVVVSHGDTRTTYEPVAASVSRGELVRQGEVLGELELLGSHCLPQACLHWGLIRDDTYLDPLTLVGRGPVRLVPWGGLPASPWP